MAVVGLHHSPASQSLRGITLLYNMFSVQMASLISFIELSLLHKKREMWFIFLVSFCLSGSILYFVSRYKVKHQSSPKGTSNKTHLESKSLKLSSNLAGLTGFFFLFLWLQHPRACQEQLQEGSFNICFTYSHSLKILKLPVAKSGWLMNLCKIEKLSGERISHLCKMKFKVFKG